MEKFGSQQFRDKLAKEIKEVPKEERKEVLEHAKETPEYWQARTEKIRERQEEVEIDEGLGVLVKRKTIYHGSGISGIKKFDKAEEDTVGSGIYFTSEAKDAIGYARLRSKREQYAQRADGKPVIEDSVPVIYESSVENIKLCDLRKGDNVKKVLDGFRQVLESKMQGLNDGNIDNFWRSKSLQRAVDAINSGKVGAGNLREVTFSTGKTFSDYIKSLGYEGLITLEGGEGGNGNHDTYLIFDSEKITINQEQAIRFEQERPIPELKTHETSPRLEAGAAQVLKNQWEKFWELRFTKPKGNVSTEKSAQDPNLLKDGTLLHNLRYDENALSKILQSGVLSGELGYGEKESRAEDAETHYCADFFVNQGDKSVAQFVEFAYGNEENVGSLKKKRIESFSCPREQNDSIAVVVDPSKPELAELLQHSATGIDASRLANFPVRFPYGAEKPDIAKRHLAVLVGIPANYISLLVIGGKLASDQEKLTKLKTLVANSGLDIAVLNYKGERI
ncbi:hypothetical protein HYW59_04205 [Candidatus Kaiserbacteria bacterium]|nr:hypothetical protein [Candidatus Kaiserbacteria bacterium]